MARWKDYYYLAKPGIVQGNLLSLVGGYILAGTLYGFDIWAGIGVIIGTAGVIGGACVFNNCLDRNIDAVMKRTQRRALVRKTVPVPAALVYGSTLSLIGFASLWLLTNPLTTLVGFVGFVWYVAIYGYAKRHTPWSTLIGTVCGATPPVAGYTAITGQFDVAALLLFLILAVWQMPHFYALAIKYEAEYRLGGLPVLSVAKGSAVTKQRMLIWLAAFCVVAPSLSFFGYTGACYAALSTGLAVYWLTIAIRTRQEPNDKKWAGRIFGVSLLVLLVQSGLFAVGHILP